MREGEANSYLSGMKFKHLHLLLFTACFAFTSSTLLAQESGTIKCSESAAYTAEGVLTTDSDQFPIMSMDSDEHPRVGDRGEMLKYFETPFFRTVMKGWLGIGVVEVVSVTGKSIKFKVIEQTSQITIDGVKKNQFAKGNRVQFSKYEYGSPVVDSSFWSNGNVKSTGTRVCDKASGEWKFFHENGTLSERYSYNEKGNKEGDYTAYYENGAVKEQGKFADGKKNGEWTEKHPNGQLLSILEWKDDQPTGTYGAWYDDGQKQEEGKYSWKGTKEGIWISWYPGLKVKEKGKYNYKGQKDGTWETFYPNGNLETRLNYYDGVIVGKQEYFFENGNPKELKQYNTQNQKDGTWKTWFENGKQESQVNYSSGVMAGENKSWYENGNLRDSGYYNYKSQKDGTWMYFYENGNPKEMLSYNAAQLNGPYAEYYESGKIKLRGQYTFGQEDGKWEGFHENGKKKSVGTYVNGKKVKTWYYWDENGKKRKEKFI